MVYKLITAPTELAITLAEAKAQLNVETAFTDDDTLITACIKAAALYVEKVIQGPVMSQVWELQLTDFLSTIELNKGLISTIDSLKYYDSAEADQTVAASNYQTDLSNVPARLILKSTYVQPTVYDRFDAVRVRFTAGYATASNVPEDVKQVIKLLVTHFYEYRSPEITGGAISKFDLTIEKLLSGHTAWL
ncbi:MAG: head-tail connector protein [Cyclobacteriaceae bacterium]